MAAGCLAACVEAAEGSIPAPPSTAITVTATDDPSAAIRP
jgi:hypothetical protein